MGRKQAREGAISYIYQCDMNKEEDNGSLDLFLDNFQYSKSEADYIENIAKGINENMDRIDSLIEKNLQGWKLERLAKVDLAILRVSIYEILYRDDIPVQVSINEAIENAKKYSAEDSFKFINGVLGEIVRSLN